MRVGFKVGDIVEAEVTRITDFGAFAKINGRTLGLIHISQVSRNFVKDINQHLKVGEKVRARVIKCGPGKKVELSLKGFKGQPAKRYNSGFKASDLEEKLNQFLSVSEQKK